MVLDKEPSDPVVIDISGGGQLDVSPAQLTFSTSDWDVLQEVTVSAVDDTLPEGPHVGWIRQTVTSADLNYDRATIDDIVVRIADNDWSLDTTPYVDLGHSDNVALDQPRVTVGLFEDAAGTQSVGPATANTWLLDTGSNTTSAYATAVNELLQPPYVYQTEGTFLENGIAGSQQFDISAPYRFDFQGSSLTPDTLPDARILSDATNELGMLGVYGIVGMPAMDGRVTTLDMTVWTSADLLGDNQIVVDFANEVPPGDGNRYSVVVDTRTTFSPDAQITSGDYPPMWADVPFLTAMAVNHTAAAGGDFIFDTGAQQSVLSTRVAQQIGLDSNADGVLDEQDANFVRYATLSGVGGTVQAPVFLLDEVRVPTQQGVDLVWTDLQWIVLDIADGVDGVLGSDLLTAGWIRAFFVDGQSGSIMQSQLDFRQLGTDGEGLIYFDLNPQVNLPVDPLGPGARVIPTGGATTVSEMGVDDSYQVVLTQQPAGDVTISLDVDPLLGPSQLTAVDAAHPSKPIPGVYADRLECAADSSGVGRRRRFGGRVST